MEYVKGYIYNSEDKYVVVTLENTLENIASFIARCSPSNKVMVTDMLDQIIVKSMGNFLDRVCDMNYRDKLLEVLLPMQYNDGCIKDVDFTYGEYETTIFNMDRKKFIEFVKEKAEYNLEGDVYDIEEGEK